ncbi:MAG: hypothetical protein IJV98_03450 [Clostridia bacterium]|nr:hypothetical protein [Clostridia bacterium]
MDYQRNKKYFESTDTLFYVGIPILIVGALLVILELAWFMFMPYQMVVGLVIAIVGAALAFIPRSMRASEKELDAAIAAMKENYATEVTERLGLKRSLVRGIAPTVIGDHIYKEGVMLRRGKDDRKCRSSEYSAAAILTTKDGIVVSVKTFSLIEENVTETLHEFVFSDFGGLSVRDEEYVLTDGVKIKCPKLVVTSEGKEALALPTRHVIAVDRLCEDVNRLAGV